MTDRFVKLTTTYYDDVVLSSLDDAHEVMFTRALALCGRSKTNGFIPRSKVLELSRKRTLPQALTVASGLCKSIGGFDGPFIKVDGGFQIRNWHHYQEQLVALEDRRRSDRERKRRQRAAGREGTTSDVRRQSRDTSRDVTPTEEEKEEDAAAAAGSSGSDHPAIDILMSKLRAHTALSSLRSDTLRPAQVATIVGLIDQHGDDALVQVAINTTGHPAPRLVSAYIGTWEAMAATRSALRVVDTDPRCDICNARRRDHDAPAYSDHPFTERNTA